MAIMLMGRTGPTGGMGCILQNEDPSQQSFRPTAEEPGADDQMVLLSRKDMCCQEKGSEHKGNKARGGRYYQILSKPCPALLH